MILSSGPKSEDAGIAADAEPLYLYLVEDDPLHRELYAELLAEGNGFEVRTKGFESVHEACASLVDEQPDCIVLDLHLPDIEGLQGLDMVQTAAGDVPVIMLTGHSDQATATAALQAGAQDYLSKDEVDGPALRRAVRYAVERFRIERLYEKRALFDPLTGLPGRPLFSDRLQQAINRSRRSGDSLALLFLDLNRFKRVNDSLGHDAGDALLCEVATRLSGILRATDTVARFGGDEFVILCEGAAGDSIEIAKRIETEVTGSPIMLGERPVHVGFAVGIAFADGSTSLNDVLRRADIAMYRAKETNQGYVIFDEEMQADLLVELDVEAALRGSLERGLEIHYQPQVWVEDGRLFGFEALSRWRHPEHGVLPPDQFLPLVERMGLMPRLGARVVAVACEQLSRWRSEGLADDLVMSVNLSPTELVSEDLAIRIPAMLERYDIPPPLFCVEITERCLVTDVHRASAALEKLRQLGVQVSIDDFGGSFSSLNVLSEVRFDYLKLDRSLISELGDKPAKRALLQGIGGMARGLRAIPLAEGIETAEEAAATAGLGCRLAQGYLYGRPAPAAEIETMLREVSAQ